MPASIATRSRAAAVELAEQFPHAGLHLLPAGVQVELDSGLNEVLLAHAQVIRTRW
jgi:hypothetical protein